jgi:amidophosphoribosyltransferase
VRYPNVYGIDMPAAHELVAHGRTVDEVAEVIGADRLFYQDLDDLIRAVNRHNARLQQFDTSIFTGEYVTGDVSVAYLKRLEGDRSDEAKTSSRRRADGDVIELHNAC